MFSRKKNLRRKLRFSIPSDRIGAVLQFRKDKIRIVRRRDRASAAGADAVYIIVRNGLKHFLLDKNFVADGTMLAFGQARLRAGRRDGGVDHFGVTFRRDRARLRLAAGAGALLFPFFRARRGDRHRPFAEVMFVRLAGVVGATRVVGLHGAARLVVRRRFVAGGKAHDASERKQQREQYDPKLFHPSFLPYKFAGMFPLKRKKRAFGRRHALHCSISDRCHTIHSLTNKDIRKKRYKNAALYLMSCLFNCVAYPV